MTAAERHDFVDWMKGIGISLIVYGHVAHASTTALTPPIYVKQLGVACFVFVTGFTLARERRAAAEVLFNRLFQLFFFGLMLAGLITLWGVLHGSGLALSNYLPFLGGANVVFDHFPANPTTWYVGTYFHLLIIWALVLRHLRARLWMVAAAALAVEIPIRAALITRVGPYVGYMLFTSWIAVFLLGLVRGSEPARETTGGWLRFAATWTAGLAVWALAAQALPFRETFPFMTVDGWSAPSSALLTSAAASFLYVVSAALCFEASRRVPAPAMVKFFARNSLIVFLAHMPVFFALQPRLTAWGFAYWSRTAIQLLVCLVGLGWMSELIGRLIEPNVIRGRLLELRRNRRRASLATDTAMAFRGER